MPRYYFDVVAGSAETDRTGTILLDQQTMRSEALLFVAALLGEEQIRLGLGSSWTLVVRDNDGVVFRLDVKS